MNSGRPIALTFSAALSALLQQPREPSPGGSCSQLVPRVTSLVGLAAPGYGIEVTSSEPGRPARAAQQHERPQGMGPGRQRRRTKVERGMMRLIATGGIVAIAVLLGAVLVSQDVAGWIVGLVVGLTSVILAALLWSSRQL